MTREIDNLAKQTGLKPAQAEGLLNLFCQQIKNQDLLIATGLAKSVLDDFRSKISKYLLPSSDKTVFNQEGVKWVQKINPQSFKWQMLVSGKIPKALDNIFIQFSKKRDKANRKLDQFRATKETVWRRAVLMRDRGDLDGRRLLFLGDADWTCLAVAFLKQTRRIFVLDIDDRVLDDLKEVSQGLGLKIECLKHDLANPLPNHLLGNFDVVFSDPPYTDRGVNLFLSRSIEALDKNLASRIFFCYGQSDRAREKTLIIQGLLNHSGLLIEECLPKFNRYLGATSIGSSSTLYINSITGKTKPGIVGRFTAPIYTWQK